MNRTRPVSIAGALALVLALGGAGEAAAQQSGRATGSTGRAADRFESPRRNIGDAFGIGSARGYAPGVLPGGYGFLEAWSWSSPNVRLICRPLGPPSAIGAGSFIAECSAAPFGAHAGGYGSWYAPPPIVMRPEERPHRFYSRFNPDDAGSGMPPLTCDPRPGAPCPPTPATQLGAGAPPAPYGTPRAATAGGYAGDCAEITARTVTGVVYRGRVLPSALGVEHAEDAGVAIESALARGATVALLGEHGYPIYLPPASFLESVDARACRR